MAQLMSTSCLKLVAKINERDQDALLSRLDELQAQGMPAQRAQIQAAIDVLSGLRREAANASSIPEDQDVNPDQPDIKRSTMRVVDRLPEELQFPDYKEGAMGEGGSPPIVVLFGRANVKHPKA